MTFVMQAGRLGQVLLDGLYPRSCCACGASLNEEAVEQGLCWDCRSQSQPLGPPCCDRCGMAVAGRVDHRFVCADCHESPPAFDHARSLYQYEGGVREAIHALKYRRDLSVVPDLARLLVAGLQTIHPDGSVLLCPVPLHPKRQALRGYNQVRELIVVMEKLDSRLQRWEGLLKVKDTDSQTALSKAGRRNNVKNAFRVAVGKADLPDALILLDDVMTTGATLDACARTLKKQRKDMQVSALTLARG